MGLEEEEKEKGWREGGKARIAVVADGRFFEEEVVILAPPDTCVLLGCLYPK